MMSNTIQLIPQAEKRERIKTDRSKVIRIRAASSSSLARWCSFAAALCILALWATASILNDFLLFKEVVTSSFIILCLLFFKWTEQDRRGEESAREFN